MECVTLYAGVMDSSGMRFHYTDNPPQHRAGIMTVGHDVTKIMIIPPTAGEGYTSSGICTPSCTERVRIGVGEFGRWEV